MGFFIGLLAMAAAVYLLFRLKARDLADCTAVLGLPASAARTERGTTPEGLAYVQHAVLAGTLEGHPATVWSRDVRHPAQARRRGKGSSFTVLELTLPGPVRTPLCLQPVGMLGALESLAQGPASGRLAVDPAFDDAYVTYAGDGAAARVVLSPSLRAQILDFRRQVAGDLPPNTAGHLSSGLLLGTFHLEGATARYALFGSPTRAVAEHLKGAVPVLRALAAAAGAGRG